MDTPTPTRAEQVARAALAFEKQCTGIVPESVSVVLGADTVVITLHGALSPAERALAQSPAGAAQVQAFHRELFNNAAETLRAEIARITGVPVRESAADIEARTGTVVHAFAAGTIVQVFLLAGEVPTDSWSPNAKISRPDA